MKRIVLAAAKPVAWLFITIGILIDLTAWLGFAAKDSDPFVLHLSTWALIYAGFAALVAAYEGERR